MSMASKFNAEFASDGSGDWRIYLPANADKHDVLALGPVIDGLKTWLEPTIAPAEPPKFIEPATV